MKVSNAGCIRRLGLRSMKAARARNAVAALAIALTTVLFTSLFTIAASINYSFQQENFRRAGGDAHGSIKDITWEQAEQLRRDPLIQDSWCRLFVGMPHDPPFSKSHVEISYMEPNGAPHYFCAPVEGTLPREGTQEAATDTRVLALLGVEPKAGAQFTLPITLDDGTAQPRTIQRTFTLSGWWEYDSAVPASNVLLPRSAAEELCALSNGEQSSMTGKWNLDVMFQSAAGIRENLGAVLGNYGYQHTAAGAENYLDIGVNWGYTGGRISENFDPMTIAAIVVILLLIIFTGYLIIYNVFQISVTNDIRFYGLLKTIGTTGKQLKRVIRQQALLLSLVGIPAGLLLGFVIGNRLTPLIMAYLSYQNAFVSLNPWIFIGAAAFSLLTVFLSCARPGRIAARVSPVEAVRYAEGGQPSGRKGGKRAVGPDAAGASLPRMAWANLGRSRSKTAVTVISLALAVVLMNLVYTFANGFDMEKYLSGQVVTDFVLGHADYFQTGVNFHSADQALSEEIIAQVSARDGITEGGRVYGQEQSIQALLPEEYFRRSYSSHYSEEMLDSVVASQERAGGDAVVGVAQLYGLEDFILSEVHVLAGDLTPLSDPSRNAIAAVYSADEHGAIDEDVNCFQVGDTVTLRYVKEWMNVDVDTGEELSAEETAARWARGEASYVPRAKVYEEKEYTVCAQISIPSALTYRYSTLGASELAMGAELFQQDTGMSSVMVYAFNTGEASNAAMENFLKEYTQSVQPTCGYESRQSKTAEFEGFRTMFLTMGGTLAGIIGLVGVLNFINAVLTGILTRKRELAMLQSVGMTGKQLNTMLVYEGLYYTMLSAALSLVLSAALGPLVGSLCSAFWFFTYQFTVLPVLAVIPLFLVLGVLIPLLTYRSVNRRTIVERLREMES
ncbi:MAG: ABC transporter permease [Oscillospiraceae bacterium]|nr:ABC transporter permease [Oscillospiraceae bacterium]